MAIGKDAYESAGGDASWEAWLDICSVAGVQEQCPDLTEGLRSQISSAMTSALVRSGYSSKEFESDDPVAFFDSYFLLGSDFIKAIEGKGV